jgi:hypothetical protein
MKAIEIVIKSVAFIGVPVFRCTRATQGGIMSEHAM